MGSERKPKPEAAAIHVDLKNAEAGQARFSRFFDVSNDLMCVAGSDGRFKALNPMWAKTLGYATEELLDKPFFEFTHPEDVERTTRQFATQIEGGVAEHFVNRYRRKDGSYVWLEWTATNARDGFVYAVARDISDRMQAEAALRESSAEMAAIIENTLDSIWTVDRSYKIAYANSVFRREFYASFGVSPEPGVSILETLPEGLRPLWKSRYDRVFGKERFEIVDELDAGAGRIHFSVLFTPVIVNDVVVGAALYGKDITRRKEAEQTLLENEARFRELFVNAADAIFIADMETGIILDANRAASRLTLLPLDRLVGIHQSKLHPERVDRQSKEEFGEHVAVSRKMLPTGPTENTVLRSDGTEVPVEILAAMVTLRGKQCLMGTFREIGDRKRAEEKTRKSEEFIRKILDTVDEGFIVIDRDYRILTANRAYCEQHGGVFDTITGRHCYEVSHKSPRPCYEHGEDCSARHVFETGSPYSTLHKHTDAKGALLYVETKSFPIKDSAGVVVSVIETIQNITEKHLLEEERLKTQKLESIGTLAGGIAHDFNNLLQGVFGYISLAKMNLEQEGRSRAMLEQAEEALHLAVNLTTQLLTFSKGGKPVMKRLALQPVIESATKFALSGSRTDCRLEIAPDLWAAEADGGQISQVIQNTVLNADQAMPLGGSVVIAARNVAASDASLPKELQNADSVLITIRDSGIGIAEEYLDKIFDPYFTTKAKGSGLGLATSYSIVRNHGGLLRVQSEVGRGTTIFLYLPAAKEHGEASGTPVSRAGRRKGRVLVMDDEEMIRLVAGEMLREMGHEVVSADKGETALEAYRAAAAAGAPFDVVILDLTIRGGMGGEETLARLREMDADVRAVVSSGYSGDAALTTCLDQGFRAVLKKPYNMQNLQDTVQNLLP